MIKLHLDDTNRIWKDKRINPEGKLIYLAIYSKGFDKLVVNINVGELQQIVKINNIGLRKHLNRLERSKYLQFREYDTGMYQIHLL